MSRLEYFLYMITYVIIGVMITDKNLKLLVIIQVVITSIRFLFIVFRENKDDEY